jgi:hypothetical protein
MSECRICKGTGWIWTLEDGFPLDMENLDKYSKIRIKQDCPLCWLKKKGLAEGLE